jgi:dethiobiotin synthetase
MSARILFITGTDTGAGKTFFAATLASLLRQRSVNVAALKPVCSGGRDDAGAATARGQPEPDEEPRLRAAIAPVYARRNATVRRQVVAHILRQARRLSC